MALDALIAVIDRLREKMKDHAHALRQSEAMTRYALIDPLLAALDWEPSDPSQVRPEYKVGKKWADYALLKADGTTPSVFVEAKSLDRALSEGVGQSITYCVEMGIPYFVVTNGREWALYDVFRPVPIEEKRVGGLDISGKPSEAAFSALGLLWKPLLRDEVKPSPPVTLKPISEPPGNGDPTGGALPPTAVIPPTADTTDRNWPDGAVSLDELEPKIGVGERAPPPKRLFLPDGQQKSLGFWKDLLVEIGRYLVANEKLSSPVKGDTSGSFIVHTDPDQPRSEPIGKGLCITTNAGAVRTCQLAYRLLSECGEDPSCYGVEGG